MVKLICYNCEESFEVLYPSWAKNTCSKSCAKDMKRLSMLGVNNHFFGKSHSKETKKLFSDARTGLKGKQARRWLGDKAGYRALHMYVQSIKGKASVCSVNIKHDGPYHWANKSGEYLRDMKDWHELCASCNRTDGVKMAERFKEGGYYHSI